MTKSNHSPDLFWQIHDKPYLEKLRIAKQLESVASNELFGETADIIRECAWDAAIKKGSDDDLLRRLQMKES